MYEDQNRNEQPESANREPYYQYTFRPEDQYHSEKKGKNNGDGFFKVFMIVVLCVALSFGAGIGGAVCAMRKLPAAGTTTVNPAPNKDSLHSSNPDQILNRNESVYSPYGSAGENPFSISEVVRMVQDSVVVIEANLTNGTGSGSGVIISEEGYILTCNHVVEGAKSVRVKINSGGVYQATCVGQDETSDLAVLKIEPIESEPLNAAKHGKSGNLVVGEHVVAIGNPLGTLGGTVTDGIISATEREITSGGVTMTLLQTNAAINSGNSGGGLFNLNGELIGIVNAKYAASGVEGLAFAIPIDSAYEVECDLIQYGYKRGIIDHGLSTVEITAENLQYYYWKFKIDQPGLYVVSSKYNESLQNKDRIVSVNGVQIKTESDFRNALAECKVGDVLTIRYISYNDSVEKQTAITVREYVPDSANVNFS